MIIFTQNILEIFIDHFFFFSNYLVHVMELWFLIYFNL